MGPMQPQQPNPYAQLFNGQRGAQQPQGVPPMRPMMGPPPTGAPRPQMGANPYAAMLAQVGRPTQGLPQMGQMPQGQRPPMPGQMPPQMGQGMPQMGQGMPQMNPQFMQQRMAMAQQMAQQQRPQMGQMPQSSGQMIPTNGMGGASRAAAPNPGGNPYASAPPANPWGAR